MTEVQIELSLDEEIEMSKARTAELVERKNKEMIEKRTAALAPVLAAIKAHGFTAQELGMTVVKVELVPKKSDKRAAIEPKYQDPESGAVWAGRGKMPAWMSRKLVGSKAKEDFLINKPAPAYDVLAGLNVAPAESGEPAAGGDLSSAGTPPDSDESPAAA